MPKIYRHTSGTEHVVCRATKDNCGKVADWLFARGVKLAGQMVWQIHWLRELRKLHVTDYAIIIDGDGSVPWGRRQPNATIRQYGELSPEYELVGEYHE